MSEPRPPANVKQEVAHRASYCCEYCLSREDHSPSSSAVEHIRPRAGGGSNEPDNLAYSCQECNNRKFTRKEAIDPITGENVPLYHPRQHRWRDHFVWNEGYSLMLGISPTGRATIERMRLNRIGVVNLRKVLTPRGLHPPEETINESELSPYDADLAEQLRIGEQIMEEHSSLLKRLAE